MEEAGTMLHMAASGRVILRADRILTPGVTLCDSKGRRVAKVVEMFGPVNSPYASALPLTDRVTRSVGRKLYILKKRGKN